MYVASFNQIILKHPIFYTLHTAGNMHRRFMKYLHRLIRCDECGFGPWRGSPIEPIMCLLLLTMIDSLVPFQILHIDVWKEYYGKALFPRVNIKGSYHASIWKINAVHYLTLFCSLMTRKHYTRYQHVLTQCGEYWMDLTHTLHSTPRGLFGADPGEQMNDEIKQLIKTCTLKFMNATDIERVIQNKFIKRYMVNEEVAHLRTDHAVGPIRKKQIIKDYRAIFKSDDLRRQFQNDGIDLSQIADPILNRTQEIGLLSSISMFEDILDHKDSESETEDIDDSHQMHDHSIYQSSRKATSNTTPTGTEIKDIVGVRVYCDESHSWQRVEIDVGGSILLNVKHMILMLRFDQSPNPQMIWKIYWKMCSLYQYCLYDNSLSASAEHPLQILCFKFTKSPIFTVKRGRSFQSTNRDLCRDAAVTTIHILTLLCHLDKKL